MKNRVSIHAPTRGATFSGIAVPSLAVFQSTRPHGARHVFCFYCFHFALFQSTRPHGARLPNPRVRISVLYVSIHAPTRGATKELITQQHKIMVSIHAPTRGATSLTQKGAVKMAGFNPRAHTGRDLFAREQVRQRNSFNPRAHTGRD